MWPEINKVPLLAIARRDLRLYFSSPTGYVFITLFILLSAAGAFWQGRFFANNLANLDQLNQIFPYLLLFFIPALTMSVWADERKQGTDELLLTLPATDVEVVLGKYLALVGIFGFSLLLSLSHVLVLIWLGSPDLGLIFSNYLGYFMIGVALLSVGMFASLLTANATVSFILGALFCAILVLAGTAPQVIGDWARGITSGLDMFGPFGEFSRGIVSPGAIVYFASVTLFFLFLNVTLIGRRHWPQEAEGRTFGLHRGIQITAIAVALIAANVIIGRFTPRLDVTAEQIHSLTPGTSELITSLPDDRVVFVQAYISPEVPREYVETRTNLINALKRIAALDRNKVQVVIYETEPYSKNARDAREKFNILPRQVVSNEGARVSTADIFLGIAFTSGAREEVIPFMDRGLPIEYELVRSIRTAANTQRKKIGVLATEAKVFGGFDQGTFQNQPAWQFVDELRKQYDVSPVEPDQLSTGKYDCLVAILPSSLSQPEIESLNRYVLAGNPTLILEDPLPVFSPSLSPILPPGAGANPFQQRQQPQKEKGDISTLYSAMGLNFNTGQIIWDNYNPHPDLGQMQPEIVFVGRGNQSGESFNDDVPVTRGLQELVALYSGALYKSMESPFTFTPLVKTGHVTGAHQWQNVVQRSFFGMQINRNPRRQPTGESYVLAAEISGSGRTSPDTTLPERKIKAIVVADVDLISDQFFSLRAQGLENISFDNVTFVLNSIDQLVGDSSFIAMRTKRVRHRTLARVEAQTRTFIEKRLAEEKEAEGAASAALSQAQDRLNQSVAAIRNRTDLDEQTKQIMVQNLQEVENRRFEVTKTTIEEQRDAKVSKSKEDANAAVVAIQNRIKALAVMIPPVPVLVLGVMTFMKRRKRELEGAAASRRLRSN